jgi:hypothetical protein
MGFKYLVLGQAPAATGNTFNTGGCPNSNVNGTTVKFTNIQASIGTCDYQRIATTWPAEYTSIALAAGYPISLYSDRAGTTATVGPDDPVGVLLDQSEGLALGPELAVGGTFDSSIGSWVGTNWAWGSGKATHTTGSTGSFRLENTLTLGKLYSITAEVLDRSAGQVGFSAGQSTPAYYSANGTFKVVATCATDTHIRFTPSSDFNGSLDNIFVREIPGYHATAPSDAARPNLRLDGNGKFYLDRDTTDDNLPITWPANYTTTAAQYVADQTTTTETTGITLNGATSYTTPQRPTGDYGRIIFKTPTPNSAKVKKYLDKKAGR